jgi:hypothetical protein
MDGNGARALALRIQSEQGNLPDYPKPAPLVTPDAAPIFHWLGIEPPDTTQSTTE